MFFRAALEKSYSQKVLVTRLLEIKSSRKRNNVRFTVLTPILNPATILCLYNMCIMVFPPITICYSLMYNIPCNLNSSINKMADNIVTAEDTRMHELHALNGINFY